MNRNSSCMPMVQGKRLRTAQPFANLQHRQIIGLAESSSVWGTRRNHRGQIRAVRRMTKHFNGPSVDCFLSRRSPMARRIVMMKQHGRQQGCSFLPHGSKEVSVQYLLVRNVNHRKRSTKHVINCFHIINNAYQEMLNVV